MNKSNQVLELSSNGSTIQVEPTKPSNVKFKVGLLSAEKSLTDEAMKQLDRMSVEEAFRGEIAQKLS